MSTTPRPSRRRLTTIAVSALLVALAPGLTVAAAKGDSNNKNSTKDTATTVPVTTTTTTTATTVEVASTDSSTLDTVRLSDAQFEQGTLEASTSDGAGSDGDGEAPTSLSDVVSQIGADRMWRAGYTGAGVDVALIDTGVAPVVELSSSNVFVGPDLSFEGNIDAVAGLDTYGHGTHMAGIIAGRTPGTNPLNPGPGDFIGVAPDARIVSVKVADNTGAVDVSQVIAAIDWVVQNRNVNGLNIRVLNLSYNTTGSQNYVDDPLSKAVENAWNHGITVVVSAGNEGRGAHGLANPATNPRVISVSSATFDTAEKEWLQPAWVPSGDGVRNPDVLAPGVSIASLRNPGSRIDTEYLSGRVDDERLFLGSGTSQSAAVISGAAALLLQHRPDLTPDEIKHLLTETATAIVGNDKFTGNGVVNVVAAARQPRSQSSQTSAPATGLGSLEAARGTDHVTINDEVLIGEYTVTGAVWDPRAWVAASEAGTAWSGPDDWSGSTWSGSTWSGSTWSGSTWSGSTWSGSTWSGSTWSGSTWSGSTWSGSTWSGSTWSGSTWSGSTWSGSTWSGSTWSGSSWSERSWS